MKKVFSSMIEVCHVWASRTQSEGRAGNVFFRGDTIYSYGEHFPIARFWQRPDGETIVLFNSRTYSVSTSKHQSRVQQAVRHYEIAYCSAPNDPPSDELFVLKRGYDSELMQYALASHWATKRRLSGNIEATIASTQRFCEAVQLDVPEWAQSVPEDIAAEAEKAREAEAVRAERARIVEEERKKKERREAKKRLVDWLRGCPAYGLHYLPVKLRIKGDEIQTSHGASIPIESVKDGKLWQFIEQVRASGARLTLNGFPLGRYTLRCIEADGSIQVGCHHIKYKELEKMAELLGLTEGQTGVKSIQE